MTPEQTEYAQRVTIATLSGGLLGTLIGQAASEPPTIGKSLMGTILGAAVIGAGYGIYLRTGGTAPGEAAGIGRTLMMRRGPGAASRYAAARRRMRPRGRFENLGALGATIPSGQCITVG